jgi:hypothetical protein
MTAYLAYRKAGGYEFAFIAARDPPLAVAFLRQYLKAAFIS